MAMENSLPLLYAWITNDSKRLSLELADFPFSKFVSQRGGEYVFLRATRPPQVSLMVNP